MANEQSSVTISVVIPSYNAGALLRETLDSVLTQNHPAQEIIVVDDGSTDSTAAIVRNYGDAVRYIWQQTRARHLRGTPASRPPQESGSRYWIATTSFCPTVSAGRRRWSRRIRG